MNTSPIFFQQTTVPGTLIDFKTTESNITLIALGLLNVFAAFWIVNRLAMFKAKEVSPLEKAFKSTSLLKIIFRARIFSTGDLLKISGLSSQLRSSFLQDDPFKLHVFRHLAFNRAMNLIEKQIAHPMGMNFMQFTKILTEINPALAIHILDYLKKKSGVRGIDLVVEWICRERCKMTDDEAFIDAKHMIEQYHDHPNRWPALIQEFEIIELIKKIREKDKKALREARFMLDEMDTSQDVRLQLRLELAIDRAEKDDSAAIGDAFKLMRADSDLTVDHPKDNSHLPVFLAVLSSMFSTPQPQPKFVDKSLAALAPIRASKRDSQAVQEAVEMAQSINNRYFRQKALFGIALEWTKKDPKSCKKAAQILLPEVNEWEYAESVLEIVKARLSHDDDNAVPETVGLVEMLFSEFKRTEGYIIIVADYLKKNSPDAHSNALHFLQRLPFNTGREVVDGLLVELIRNSNASDLRGLSKALGELDYDWEVIPNVVMEIALRILSTNAEGSVVEALESIGRKDEVVEVLALAAIANACRVIHLPRVSAKDSIGLYHSLLNQKRSSPFKVVKYFRYIMGMGTVQQFFHRSSPLSSFYISSW